MCLWRFRGFLAFVAGLALFADRPAGAQIRYRIEPIVKRGDAVGDLRIKTDGDFVIGTLNDRGQLIFVAENAAGGKLLIRYADGKLTPVAAPGRTAPGGIWSRALGIASPVSMNQLGSIVFAAEVEVGNRNILLGAHVHDLSGASTSLYLLADGTLIPVAVPGQQMPGGGRFQTIQPQDPNSADISLATGLSAANDAGQHAFLARLEGGATAAYLMEPDGKLSLILKSGTVTSLGKILNVGQGSGMSQGVGLNNKGQVVLTLRVSGSVDLVALLTPGAP